MRKGVREMEERKTIAKIVDDETGEILGDIKEGDRIVSPKDEND